MLTNHQQNMTHLDTMVTTAAELSDYEIERGKPIPSFNHGAIQSNAQFAFMSRYRHLLRFNTETSLDLDGWPSTPDILIFPPVKINLKSDRIKVTGPPLGVIEILSPTQSLNDLVDKADRYFEHGVQSCWIIIPSLGGVAVYSEPGKYAFFNENDIAQDHVLGLEVPVAELFA